MKTIVIYCAILWAKFSSLEIHVMYMLAYTVMLHCFNQTSMQTAKALTKWRPQSTNQHLPILRYEYTNFFEI